MNQINRNPVKSSQIKSIGYDPSSQTLAVEFHSGGVYHYSGIHPEKYDFLMKAESIGKHFSAHIKNKKDHPFSKQGVKNDAGK